MVTKVGRLREVKEICFSLLSFKDFILKHLKELPSGALNRLKALQTPLYHLVQLNKISSLFCTKSVSKTISVISSNDRAACTNYFKHGHKTSWEIIMGPIKSLR